MGVENYLSLLPIIMLGIFFFGVTIAMFYWSAKRGQLRDFDEQAKVIFTEEEPEGEISDRFPS
ncbi:MAG: cbb3-type cytochrome oxidase assembly protein CcoS [Coraliomargarita sp.]|nr:cbb3-type cytochrome oxidase assembly protein CcoS [Coraliomargarita sp.]